ncbi:MAG: hypothetical protein WBA57_19800 [Elainellaceae cyanobacterium]
MASTNNHGDDHYDANGHHRHNHEESETDLECPRCGKHSIIHVGDQTYACLNCGFRRNLSNSSSNGVNVIFIVGSVLLLLALLA